MLWKHGAWLRIKDPGPRLFNYPEMLGGIHRGFGKCAIR